MGGAYALPDSWPTVYLNPTPSDTWSLTFPGWLATRLESARLEDRIRGTRGIENYFRRLWARITRGRGLEPASGMMSGQCSSI
jgi:hypothetical protein